MVRSVCHCEEGAKRETRQSIVSRRTRAGFSLRFLAHIRSPRAFSPRDDKSEGSDDKSGMGRVLFVIARREHLITLR